MVRSTGRDKMEISVVSATEGTLRLSERTRSVERENMDVVHVRKLRTDFGLLSQWMVQLIRGQRRTAVLSTAFVHYAAAQRRASASDKRKRTLPPSHMFRLRFVGIIFLSSFISLIGISKPSNILYMTTCQRLVILRASLKLTVWKTFNWNSSGQWWNFYILNTSWGWPTITTKLNEFECRIFITEVNSDYNTILKLFLGRLLMTTPLYHH